jgi:cyanate lyase
MQKKIGRIFREKMNDRITRTALAKRVGISESYLKAILYGSPVHLSEETCAKICRHLHLSAKKVEQLRIAQGRRASQYDRAIYLRKKRAA